MNVNTNHLTSEVAMGPDALSGYDILPENLNRAAKRKLKGRKEATVSMISGGKLSKWARKRRKEIALQKEEV